MRQNRIQRLSIVLMVLVSAFGAYWLYEYSSRIISHVFVNDWSSYRGVDGTLKVTSMMRFWAALFYLPVYIVAIGSIYFAIKLLNLYRQSIIFDVRPARQLIGLGLSLFGVFIVDSCVSAFEAPFFTQWNMDSHMLPRYIYDPGDITIALAGLGFCLIGWITREAILMKQEVESFV